MSIPWYCFFQFCAQIPLCLHLFLRLLYILKTASIINKLCVSSTKHVLWYVRSIYPVVFKLLALCLKGYILNMTCGSIIGLSCVLQWFVRLIYPTVSKLRLILFHAAAAPGSPAVSASGPGPAHDSAAAEPEPADPPCRHHLLWSLLPLFPAGLSSPAGQGGESIAGWSRQPPWGGWRQVWLDGVSALFSSVFIQRPESLDSSPLGL